MPITLEGPYNSRGSMIDPGMAREPQGSRNPVALRSHQQTFTTEHDFHSGSWESDMSWAFSCHPMILTPIFFDSKMPSIVRHGIVFRAAFFVGGRKKRKKKHPCNVPTNCKTYPESRIIKI